MSKKSLHPAIVKFLKAWEDEQKGSSEKDSPDLYKLRDRMSEKQQVVAAAELMKKLVRKTHGSLGVSIESIAPSGIFSGHTIGKALTLLVQEQGMRLCYGYLEGTLLRF